jgi:hypothetical protein
MQYSAMPPVKRLEGQSTEEVLAIVAKRENAGQPPPKQE